MSHYAQLVKPLPVMFGPELDTLPVGCEISRVTRAANVWSFSARVEAETGVWCSYTTIEDLPAFTDRGLAKAEDRELPVHPALKRGRPPVDEERKPLGVRLNDAQRAWVDYRAKLRKVSASDFVRHVLQRRGMP